MQLIIWFALKWVNGEIGEIYEIYEMVNSVKWVNGEISEMGEMANSVKSGFCHGPPEKQNSQPEPCKNDHAYIFSQLILSCSY